VITIIHLLLALAFAGLCLARMKGLGTGGALLLVGVVLFDLLLTIGYRVFALLLGTVPSGAVEAGYQLLDVASMIVGVLSAVMVLVAFILIGRTAS
jgi:hypothetical protein